MIAEAELVAGDGRRPFLGRRRGPVPYPRSHFLFTASLRTYNSRRKSFVAIRLPSNCKVQDKQVGVRSSVLQVYFK
jgi:hypothetical protein